ncbi:MAG TPA: response regulator transcription factor [Rubrobacter sp.]|nr:response regulator transcription factor [Rubrobacter sp.]
MVEDAPRRAPLRVAIAEDSGLLRAGIARLITDAGHRVIAEASDGPGFLKVIGEQRPDVAVVDVRMPPGFKDEGLKAALEARRRIPGLPVLVLSQYVEERYGRELLESGMEGTGYLLKDRVADVEEFVSAVETIGSGGTVLDPEVVGQLLARSGRNEGLASLTPREGEVLALVAEGRTNRAIAQELFITGGAVEKHVKSIFGKLGLAQSEADHRRVLAVLAYLRG